MAMQIKRGPAVMAITPPASIEVDQRNTPNPQQSDASSSRQDRAPKQSVPRKLPDWDRFWNELIPAKPTHSAR